MIGSMRCASAALAVALSAAGFRPLRRRRRRASAAAGGGEWPMYGHDVANTRTQPEETGLGPSAVAGLTPAGRSRRPRRATEPGSTRRRSSTTAACSSARPAAWRTRSTRRPDMSSGSASSKRPIPARAACRRRGGDLRQRGDLPRRRVRRAVRDRAQPLDRRGDLEERAVRPAADEQRRAGRAPTRTPARSSRTASCSPATRRPRATPRRPAASR